MVQSGIKRPKALDLEKGASLTMLVDKVFFRDALAGNRANVNGKRLSFMEGYEDGIIKFTKKDVEKTSSKWKLSLINMVVGARVPFSMMQGFINSTWQEIRAPKIILTEYGVFIFKFEEEKEMNWVLQQGTWLVGGVKPLVLRRWSEGVKLDPSCFDTTQVWDLLPNLYVRFWDDDIFEKIGSALGKPVFIDKVTENQERLSFARILVEITATKALKNEVSFHGEDGEIIVQPIKYEWIPSRCD